MVFINEITSLPVHSITSIDVVPVPKDLTTKVLQKKYLGIESDIIKQHLAEEGFTGTRHTKYKAISIDELLSVADIHILADLVDTIAAARLIHTT